MIPGVVCFHLSSEHVALCLFTNSEIKEQNELIDDVLYVGTYVEQYWSLCPSPLFTYAY